MEREDVRTAKELQLKTTAEALPHIEGHESGATSPPNAVPISSLIGGDADLEGRIWEIIEAMDADQDGELSVNEVKAVLCQVLEAHNRRHSQ